MPIGGTTDTGVTPQRDTRFVDARNQGNSAGRGVGGWALAEKRDQTNENEQRHSDEQRHPMAGPCLPKDILKPAVKLIRCHGPGPPTSS